MIKNYDEILNKYEPKKPNILLYFITRLLAKAFCLNKNIKYIYNFDISEMKNKQVCILADHSSRNNFYPILASYKYNRLNAVVGRQNFFDKSLFNLFLKMGAIPKMLYEVDYKAARDILRLKNNGASFLLFPEGIQSTIGFSHPMNPATMKLIKKMDMDIILVKSYGAYLKNPRFLDYFKKGPMFIEYNLLFKKDDLNKLSIDEMYDLFIKKFKYNDFLWNKEKQYSYGDKKGNAYGFNRILYECPICKKQEINIIKNLIVCSLCGLEVEIDNKYNIKSNKYLDFSTLDKWYIKQRKTVKELIKNDFRKEYNIIYKKLDKEKLHKASNRCKIISSGKLILTKENMKYVDESNNEIVFDYKDLVSTPILPNEGIELFYHGEFIEFELISKKNLGTEIMLIVEEMHLKIDPIWNKYSNDVYGSLDI